MSRWAFARRGLCWALEGHCLGTENADRAGCTNYRCRPTTHCPCVRRAAVGLPSYLGSLLDARGLTWHDGMAVVSTAPFSRLLGSWPASVLWLRESTDFLGGDVRG